MAEERCAHEVGHFRRKIKEGGLMKHERATKNGSRIHSRRRDASNTSRRRESNCRLAHLRSQEGLFRYGLGRTSLEWTIRRQRRLSQPLVPAYETGRKCQSSFPPDRRAGSNSIPGATCDAAAFDLRTLSQAPFVGHFLSAGCET